MLKIREEQMDALTHNARWLFVRRGIDHTRTLLPDEYARLGEERVRDSVEKAIVRCEKYGITASYDVLRFLNLMYTLGHCFDEDERYGWAAEILSDDQISSRTRLNLLVEHTQMTLANSEAVS
jgi:hypothetical protein